MSRTDLQQPSKTQGSMPISRSDLAQLCKRALRSPDPAALDQLRRHAKEVLEAWGDEEIQKALTIEPSDNVPDERITAVYEVLAEAEPCAAVPIDTREIALKADLEEERAIGDAFKNALLYGLEKPLRNLFLAFGEVRPVSSREQRHLRQTASVDAAWPDCAGLVACGLTPLGVFYATKDLFPLAKRLLEKNILQRTEPVVLAYARRSQTPPRFVEFTRYVVRQVLQVAHCSEPAAETLVDWLIDVARVKPRVFSGAWAQRDQWGVRLTADQEYSNKTLAQRWSEMAKPQTDRAELHAVQPGAQPLPRS